MESTLSKRIPLSGTINTRDLGGYKTVDGKTVKYKKILRTDALYRLSEEDIAYLVDNYHPSFDIDLRSPREASSRPDKKIPSCEYIPCPIAEDLNNRTEAEHLDYHIDDKSLSGIISYIYQLSPIGDISIAMESVYEEFVLSEFGQKHYSLFFKTLLRNKKGSVFFHCADGKDRAGIASALFLSILGVPFSDVLSDYLMTNIFTKKKAEEREKLLRETYQVKDEILISSVKAIAGVRDNWLRAAFKAIKTNYQSLNNYFNEALHFSSEEIIQLKDIYLE